MPLTLKLYTMAVELKKLSNLEYNELITLAVIENDEDLTNIFRDDVPLSFNILRSIIQKNELNEQTKELLKDIFEGIILTSKQLIGKYVNFGGKSIQNTIEHIIETKTEEPIVEEIAEIENKEKALPKWYGKQRLEKEIAQQGGKATPTQRAMLELNDLKNIYSNLLARGIKDLETNSKLLTDEDCRKISSVITIAKRQLLEIIKKK